MTPRNLLRLLAVTLVPVIVLVSCGDDDGGGVRPAAVSIDGTRITDDEVATNVKIFTFLAGLNGTPCGTMVEGETEDAACARFAIGNLIQEHIVQSYAADHDLAVAQAEKDEVFAQLEQSLGGAQAVDAKLKEAGIGRPQLQDLAGRILLFQKVQQSVGAEQADEAELRAQYEKNILAFTTLDTQHILLKDQAEAQDAYELVTAPGSTEKDFLALAKRISTDPSAKENSGALGPLAGSGLDPAYTAAAAELQPGGISEPVQSQSGWHVIRLVSKEVQPFADARAALAQQQGTAAFDTWLSEALAAASVEVNPRYGRFDPQTGTVEAITSTATGSASPSGTQAPSGSAPAPSP